MKKFSNEIKNWFCRAAVVAALALPATSCADVYDDRLIREEIEQIKKDLAELEENLNTEINALKELLAGKIVITKIETKSDGSILVILSNGGSFTVYPKSASLPSNLITVLEGEDGILYWAMYDADGEAQFIVDADGKNIAVASAAPIVEVAEDGKTIQISFDGGNTWMTTGYYESVADELIDDIEVVYSDWQTDIEGNPLPLYCVLVIDGVEVKVGMNSRLVLSLDSAYIAAGAKGEITATAEDAADFMITMPEGWKSDVAYDSKTSTFTLKISAPASSAIRNGEAVGEGVAKFIVVFNNGMSSIASIKLSTTPVRYSYILDEIQLTVGGGIKELVCGLTESASYTAAAAATTANAYLVDKTQKGAYLVDFSEELTKSVYTSYFSDDLSADKEYTFWYAIPSVDKDGKKSVAADEISAEEYSYSAPSLKVLSTSFFDAEVEFSFPGTKGYIVGFSPKESYSVNSCLNVFRENKDSNLTLNTDVAYSGSFLEFFGGAGSALEYGSEYVAWCLECGGLDEVSFSNLRTWNLKTQDFTTGGNIEITASDVKLDYTTISAKLSTAEEHIYMYYTFALPNKVGNYDDEAKLDLLLESGTKSRSKDAVTATYRDATQGSKVVLIAVAVDKDGKFGKVFSQEYTTKAIEYNTALDLTVEQPVSPSIVDTRAKVTCEGAVSYLYLCITKDDMVKRFGSVNNTGVTKAGEYMIINPTGQGVYSTKNELNALEDGCIVVKGLTTLEHALIVVAIDANGDYSAAKAVYFTPTIDMGTIVTRSDANWAVGKPTVTIRETFDSEFFNISWYVAPVEGYVAYTMAGDPAHLLEQGDCTSVALLMQYIIADCSKDSTVLADHGKKCEYSADGYSLSWENVDGSLHEEHNLPGVYNQYFYGTKDTTMIYTIWVDADGNFHEPMVYDPTKQCEVTDWVW